MYHFTNLDINQQKNVEENGRQKPEHDNIVETENIDYNTRGITLLEQSTEPDIGPQFILQFHSNKFAGINLHKTGLFSSMVIINWVC